MEFSEENVLLWDGTKFDMYCHMNPKIASLRITCYCQHEVRNPLSRCIFIWAKIAQVMNLQSFRRNERVDRVADGVSLQLLSNFFEAHSGGWQ